MAKQGSSSGTFFGRLLNIKDRAVRVVMDSTEKLASMASGSSSQTSGVFEEDADDIMAAKMRSEWISAQLRLKKDEYTQQQDIRIYVGTWNVGGKPPTADIPIDEWFDCADADIVVVGFQEVVPLDARSVLVGVEDPTIIDKWENMIERALNRRFNPQVTPIRSQSQDAAQDQGSSSLAAADGEVKEEGASDARPDEGEEKKEVDGTGEDADAKENTSVTAIADGSRTAEEGDTEETTTTAAAEKAAGGESGSGDGNGVERSESGQGTETASSTRVGEDAGTSTGGTAEDDGGDIFCSIISKQMVGVHVCMWARTSILSHIHRVQTSTVACGMLGLLANKGAVSVSMKIYSSSFAFVCAHLNSGSGEEMIRRRNSDLSDIFKRTSFASMVSANGQTVTKSITEHDFIVLFGDLNYRIEMEDDDIRQCIQEHEWDRLIMGDSLTAERLAGRALNRMQEGAITFAPTYKYIPGSAEYSGWNKQNTTEKFRSPAWCDRVLWKGEGMRQIVYCRAELHLSDHRPVAALFEAKVDDVIQSKFDMVLNDLRWELDSIEKQSQPKCKVSPSFVDFGAVEYGSFTDVTVHVTNVGSVPATFRIIPPPEGDPGATPSPTSIVTRAKSASDVGGLSPWLSVTPEEATVAVGEELPVTFSVLVDASNGSVGPAVENKGKLEAVAIVHVEQGSDFFVVLSGTYLASSWGLPLEVLAHLDGPARQLFANPPKRPSINVEPQVPKELKNMTKALSEAAKKDPRAVSSAFTEISDAGLDVGTEEVADDVAVIREAVDNDGPVDGSAFPPLAVLAALLSFFAALPSPLFPEVVREVCELEVPARVMAKLLIRKSLNAEQLTTLQFILEFLGQITKAIESPSTTPDAAQWLVASVFSDVFFQVSERKASWQRRVQCVNMLMESSADDAAIEDGISRALSGSIDRINPAELQKLNEEGEGKPAKGPDGPDAKELEDDAQSKPSEDTKSA